MDALLADGEFTSKRLDKVKGLDPISPGYTGASVKNNTDIQFFLANYLQHENRVVDKVSFLDIVDQYQQSIFKFIIAISHSLNSLKII